MIKTLDDVIYKLKDKNKKKLVVASAEEEEILLAIKEAVKSGIIEPILVGNAKKIREIAKKIYFKLSDITVLNADTLEESAYIAVKLVSDKKADFIMKGLLDTSILLKEILNKEHKLIENNLLSHVMIYEMDSYHKLLFLSDGGMNISPSYDQKEDILKNCVQAARYLDIDNIKVACIAAKEKVNPKMQATIDANRLKESCEEGNFGTNIIVEGPLAFDLAVSKTASDIKGINSEVCGDVDILLVPNIEVGNALGKSFTYMAGAKSAGLVMGATVPIILTSRSDSNETKLYSIAYGALISS